MRIQRADIPRREVSGNAGHLSGLQQQHGDTGEAGVLSGLLGSQAGSVRRGDEAPALDARDLGRHGQESVEAEGLTIEQPYGIDERPLLFFRHLPPLIRLEGNPDPEGSENWIHRRWKQG